MENGIRNLEVKKDQAGNISSLKVVFGPHYFLEIEERNGKIVFVLGATHHGFTADATGIGKGLEEMIYTIKKKYPESNID